MAAAHDSFAATTSRGIPMLFVWDRTDNTVRYYDRRYTLTPDQPGYGINHTCELGQCCGGPRMASDFRPDDTHGIRGWHEVDAWDLDARTVQLVGTWLRVSGYTPADAAGA
jgi:hypothetical protein